MFILERVKISIPLNFFFLIRHLQTYLTLNNVVFIFMLIIFDRVILLWEKLFGK